MNQRIRIAIASDHAGYRYKSALSNFLKETGHTITDFGTNSESSCDYPDFIHPAAASVASGENLRGIVLGGSGNGEAIAANRHVGVRCAICWNEESARLARRHNDANMISLGERMMSLETAIELVKIFLSEEFEGGRHVPRIEKIDSRIVS